MVTPLRENSSMISGEMEEETERCVEVDCTKTLLSRGVDILSVTEVIDEGDECRKINLNVRGSDCVMFVSLNDKHAHCERTYIIKS